MLESQYFFTPFYFRLLLIESFSPPTQWKAFPPSYPLASYRRSVLFFLVVLTFSGNMLLFPWLFAFLSQCRFGFRSSISPGKHGYHAICVWTSPLFPVFCILFPRLILYGPGAGPADLAWGLVFFFGLFFSDSSTAPRPSRGPANGYTFLAPIVVFSPFAFAPHVM